MSSNPLDALVADLKHAAGPGAARLTKAVGDQAKTDLEVDAAVRTPGPGLAALTKRRGSSASASVASSADVGAVADRAAAALADGGAALPVGRKR